MDAEEDAPSPKRRNQSENTPSNKKVKPDLKN